jgi:hypothetical protein
LQKVNKHIWFSLGSPVHAFPAKEISVSSCSSKSLELQRQEALWLVPFLALQLLLEKFFQGALTSEKAVSSCGMSS